MKKLNLRHFHHTCKFSTLTINFSEVWPWQMLELGKQFNLMIHFEDVLKVSWRWLCKTIWPNVLKISWRRLKDVLKMSRRRFWKSVLKASPRRLQDVLKTSWRRLRKRYWRCLDDVFAKKTPWKRVEDVLPRRLEEKWPRQIYWSGLRRLEEVVWKRMTKINIFV